MYEIGYEDYFFGEGVCLIEWSKLIEELIPSDAATVLIEKDLEKSIEKKEKELEIYSNTNSSKINSKILERYKSYLDWIELVYLKNKIKKSDIFEFNEINKKDI